MRTKTTTTLIRLSPELLKKVKARATKERLSRSEFIRRVLDKYCESKR
jgi:predicted DNA binding CopG/RHH family protein